ncbi:unnamed protein product, partial [Nesidiocoris tenuis]
MILTSANPTTFSPQRRRSSPLPNKERQGGYGKEDQYEGLGIPSPKYSYRYGDLLFMLIKCTPLGYSYSNGLEMSPSTLVHRYKGDVTPFRLDVFVKFFLKNPSNVVKNLFFGGKRLAKEKQTLPHSTTLTTEIIPNNLELLPSPSGNPAEPIWKPIALSSKIHLKPTGQFFLTLR